MTREFNVEVRTLVPWSQAHRNKDQFEIWVWLIPNKVGTAFVGDTFEECLEKLMTALAGRKLLRAWHRARSSESTELEL